MPIYELKCPKCRNKTEVILAMDAELPLCPHCNIQMERSWSYKPNIVVRWKGDIHGETRGSRMYGAEITRKTRK